MIYPRPSPGTAVRAFAERHEALLNRRIRFDFRTNRCRPNVDVTLTRRRPFNSAMERVYAPSRRTASHAEDPEDVPRRSNAHHPSPAGIG